MPFFLLFFVFGIGLGLLGLATVIADLLVTKCLKNAQFYYHKKYEIIEDEGVFVGDVRLALRLLCSDSNLPLSPFSFDAEEESYHSPHVQLKSKGERTPLMSTA